MGSSLVAATFAHQKHLPHGPFRLLVHMALTCKDDDPAPVYWGGRSMLAYALGVNDDQNGRQAVKRALRHLVDAGVIERKALGVNSRRSEYRLWITPTVGLYRPGEGVAGRTP